MRGPALATVTQRVRSEWLRKFIADPASVHTSTVMPQVLAKADAQHPMRQLIQLKLDALPSSGS
jgi:cbb3-type cytochrome oxidase cytochrome c subunit